MLAHTHLHVHYARVSSGSMRACMSLLPVNYTHKQASVRHPCVHVNILVSQINIYTSERQVFEHRNNEKRASQ